MMEPIPKQLICKSALCRVAFLPIEMFMAFQMDQSMLSQVDEQLSGSSWETDLKNITPQSIFFKRIIAESPFSLVLEVEIKHRQYVCKAIEKGIIQQFEMEVQLNNERALYDKINDSFCPRVHSTFQDENYIYILMEFAQGSNLDIYLEDQRPALTPKNLTNFVHAMGSVIEQLHMREVLHRDIKLGNFMINPANNQLRVIDFGFGKMVQVSLIPHSLGQRQDVHPTGHPPLHVSRTDLRPWVHLRRGLLGLRGLHLRDPLRLPPLGILLFLTIGRVHGRPLRDQQEHPQRPHRDP